MKNKIKTTILIVLILLISTVVYLYISRENKRLDTLEETVVELKNRKPDTEVIEVIKYEIPIVGAKGEKGDQGEIPEGHWEEYCLYDRDIAGYPTEGVMIRQAQGDCDDDWRVVKLWEK